ncbi:serine hydrolase domain-containing protein [Paenibacillus sp.]|uniref:serine hydrolase domain-containing protein n=1 Tax=Paenibacillus sp. TaxID=58172 RepID=UPI00282318A6|nr:serine hydrolase domain-containing protein [Paenibacillus sp.]MDR0270887.1 beta-lactamase family protein [Paenibacillus sp.]
MKEIQQMIEQLDRLLSEYISHDRAAAGLAVGIVYNHQPIYAKGFGRKNTKTGEPVDEHTLFHMASISKTYVATAVMQLVEQGAVQLDEKVIAYLPYFQLQDERYRDITVRQLLSHTSGMPDEDEYEWDRPQYDEDALERYVRRISERELMWDPDIGKYEYSNIGFEILGDLIAKVSGVSFEQYMTERILTPLQMKTSSYFKPGADEHLLASPHIMGMNQSFGARVSDIYPYNRAHGPSSTLLTSAVESCHYAMAYLNRGVLSGSRILQESSVDEVWRDMAPADDFGYFRKIGLGWFMGQYRGFKAKAHGGSDTGFRSNLVLLPEKGIAVTIMFNTDYLGLHSVNNAILDVLLGEQVTVIPRSFTMHLAGVLASEGIEAAVHEHAACASDRASNGFVPMEMDFSFRTIAQRLLDHGERDNAVRVLELAIRLEPQSEELHFMLERLVLNS